MRPHKGRVMVYKQGVKQGGGRGRGGGGTKCDSNPAQGKVMV